MQKRILSGLVIIASAVIVVSFLMPWAGIATSAVGATKDLSNVAKEKLGITAITKKFFGELDKATDKIAAIGDIKIKGTVKGYQIPILVNNKTSKIALAIAQIMFKSTEGLGAKSYLVYLLPLLGIFSGLGAVLGLKKKFYIIAMLITSGAVSITGLYNLKTANLPDLVVKISIGSGLWMAMYAFLFIFLASIAWLALDRKP